MSNDFHAVFYSYSHCHFW